MRELLPLCGLESPWVVRISLAGASPPLGTYVKKGREKSPFPLREKTRLGVRATCDIYVAGCLAPLVPFAARSRSIWRNSARLIFPLLVLGRSSTNSTLRGYLYGAVTRLTCS